MQGSDDHASDADLPGPPDGARPAERIPAPAPSDSSVAPSDPNEPVLPPSEAGEQPPTEQPVAQAPVAESWYRTDQDRNRSVNQLANPWYRRVSRGLIGMAFLVAAAVGLYFGAQLVRDILDRDQLPAEAAEVPTVRSTTIEIRSTTPAPVLDGTLILDTVTGSYEFVGRGTGPQASMQVVSPDGATVYVRRDAGAWQIAPAGDQLVADVRTAVDYLRDDENVDVILTRDIRRNYVDLIEQTEIGEGDDELVRYAVRIDTVAYEENFPLEYADFEQEAIPGVPSVRGLLVTITVDEEDVLVQVDVANTNWAWQRLSYSDQAFVPIDPSVALLTDSIEVDDGSTADG